MNNEFSFQNARINRNIESLKYRGEVKCISPTCPCCRPDSESHQQDGRDRHHAEDGLQGEAPPQTWI